MLWQQSGQVTGVFLYRGIFMYGPPKKKNLKPGGRRGGGRCFYLFLTWLKELCVQLMIDCRHTFCRWDKVPSHATSRIWRPTISRPTLVWGMMRRSPTLLRGQSESEKENGGKNRGRWIYHNVIRSSKCKYNSMITIQCKYMLSLQSLLFLVMVFYW